MEISTLFKILRTSLLVLCILFLGVFIIQRAGFFHLPVKVVVRKYTLGPIGEARKWYSNYFIPYNGFFPEDLKKEWEDCDFDIKSLEDYIQNSKKVDLCKREVALALEMWKYIEKGEKNVSLDYMKEYMIPDSAIEKMEKAIEEGVEKISSSPLNTQETVTLLVAEDIKKVAEEAAKEWVENLR